MKNWNDAKNRSITGTFTLSTYINGEKESKKGLRWKNRAAVANGIARDNPIRRY